MLLITRTALENGFLYALIAMALFVSYRVLDIADLTTDGCFVLGAAVSVSYAAAGHPILAIFAAMVAGAAAGFVTAFLQTRLGVPPILAGIITNMGLYTVNFSVMGMTANINLLKSNTIFTLLKNSIKRLLHVEHLKPKELQALGYQWLDWTDFALGAAVVILAAVLLRVFLGTKLGLAIRATGDNADMVRSSSINPTFTITIGLCISNALTGLSGALVGQLSKGADINMGTGIVVTGLACLIIGETVLGRRRTMTKGILAVLLGSIIYRFIYAYVFYTKIVPIEFLKLFTALVVALAIAAPTLREKAGLTVRKYRAVLARKKGAV